MTRRLPMFPLSTVLFPGAELPLHVFEPRYRVLTERCLANDREFGVVLIARGSEVGGGDRRVDVGVVARIDEAQQLEDGRWILLTHGTTRIRVAEWLPDDPHPTAVVEPIAAADDGGGGMSAALSTAATAVRRARALLSELGLSPAAGDFETDGDPEAAGWRLCAAAPVSTLDRQRLLEVGGLAGRLELLASLADEMAADLHRLLAEGG